MPAAKPTTSMDISDIQRRMAQIRHDMHQEVQGAVKGAQSLTDWRSLVKSHPWLSISVASVVGYLLVPSASVDVADHRDCRQPESRAAGGHRRAGSEATVAS